MWHYIQVKWNWLGNNVRVITHKLKWHIYIYIDWLLYAVYSMNVKTDYEQLIQLCYRRLSIQKMLHKTLLWNLWHNTFTFCFVVTCDTFNGISLSHIKLKIQGNDFYSFSPKMSTTSKQYHHPSPSVSYRLSWLRLSNYRLAGKGK